MDFWNWNDTWAVVQHNIWWLLAAFVIGCVVAWYTCDTSRSER